MLFNSLHFFFFFVFVTAVYFVLPHRNRILLLLLSSCYFYMAFVPVYILILGFTIVVDYFAGILLEKTTGKKRRFYLICSLVANIGVLAVFKYYNFLNANLTDSLALFQVQNPIPMLSILLPIGLSFHTFQAMSYTIEVYRGNQKAERNFLTYSLYVMFYPQLVAGPIERPQNLLHQFYEKHEFNYQRVTDGLKLMAWGLFKKVVIADRVAVLADTVYNNVYQQHGLNLILGTIAFSIQIFCDFSGYSDMAIGAAEVMGFKLMKNFDRPYHARSISEFWKRWHISLSTWFKDYLYIPLGGNRVGVSRWYFNLFIVFMVSGLWHGANWTFVVWGSLHGFYLVFGLLTSNVRQRLKNQIGLSRYPKLEGLLQMACTFVLVSFAWIFFRANSIADAFYVITHMTDGLWHDLVRVLHYGKLDMGFGRDQMALAVLAVILMECIHWAQYKTSIRTWINQKPTAVRWGLYYATVLALFFMGVYNDRQFIYFQF